MNAALQVGAASWGEHCDICATAPRGGKRRNLQDVHGFVAGHLLHRVRLWSKARKPGMVRK